MKTIALHWFRQDLRMRDNPALTNASKYENTLPVYILDTHNSKEYIHGNNSKYWLHHSLTSLKNSLDGNLSIYSGNPLEIFRDILARFTVKLVCWNRCYEPWQIQRDKEIKHYLKEQGINVQTENGYLLWEPWKVRKTDGTTYKVFTPFYSKGCLKASPPRKPLCFSRAKKFVYDNNKSIEVHSLNLLSSKEDDFKITSNWKIGEKFAYESFKKFVCHGIEFYKKNRNFPSLPYVSRMSPHLHFGEISPNQLWYMIKNDNDNENINHFCRELGWREFSYNQLYHNPTLPKKNLRSKFDRFPWKKNELFLEAWCKGKTGIPMVDAGMRELLSTGYMHNRLRMVVGSFLVKNLEIHWTYGERWFWNKLVDADLANNSSGWQWISGSGIDSAPYFRIFNPVLQGKRFDPEGSYIRKYVPEINKLSLEYIFQPWKASKTVLKNSGIILGETYPFPIVDLDKSREQALKNFQSLADDL